MTSRRQTALLLVDFINDLRFDGAAAMLPSAIEAAKRTAALKVKAKQAGVSVIYANDNYGDWRSDQRRVYARCARRGICGAPVARLLKPRGDDYFIFKPRHSAFYCTPLAPLLESLDVGVLVLTGLAADICVLFTANDAHVRNLRLFVPRDCVAAIDDSRYRAAMRYFRTVLAADTRPSTELRLADGRVRTRRARRPGA
jgi:nicotinamidase-related amidase